MRDVYTLNTHSNQNEPQRERERERDILQYYFNNQFLGCTSRYPYGFVMSVRQSVFGLPSKRLVLER